MAPTAPKNSRHPTAPTHFQRQPRPVDNPATPEEREHTEPSPPFTTFRCRRDADGVTVWVPSEEIDDTREENHEA